MESSSSAASSPTASPRPPPRRLCTSTAFLNLLAESLAMSPIQLYKLYLASSISSSVSTEGLSCLPDRVIASFLGSGSRPPRFFSAWDGANLSNLEHILKVRLIVTTPSMTRNDSGGWKKIFDSGVAATSNLLVERVERKLHFSIEVTPGRRRKKNPERSCTVKMMSPADVSAYQITSGLTNIIGRSTPLLTCLAESTLELFDSPDDKKDPVPSVLAAVRNRERILAAVGCNVIYFCHRGMKYSSSATQQTDHARQTFAFLGVLKTADSDPRTFVDKAVFVGISTTCVYLPKPALAAHLKKVFDRGNSNAVFRNEQRFRTTFSEKERQLIREARKRMKEREPGNEDEEDDDDDDDDEEEDDDPRVPMSEGGPPPEADFPCACPSCTSTDYSDNMSANGPQRANKSCLGASDYLRLLGLDSDDNVARMCKALELSVSYWDCESSSFYTETARDEGLRMDEVSHGPDVAQHSGPVGRQSLVLLGYCSGFSEDLPNKCRVYKEFNLADYEGDDEPMTALCGDFYDLVYQEKVEAQRLKTELLKPLLDLVAKLREAHDDFFEEEGETKVAAAEAFKCSLLGRFEAALTRIQESFYVAGFNSAKYDNVLICRNLILALRNRDKLVHLVRSGSSVRTISVRSDQIHLVDAKLILPSGFSLDRLAKMSGAEEDLNMSKSAFPFHWLQDPVFLLRPSLPERCEEWFDPLRGSCPTQEFVDGVLQNFRENECKTAGEFLSLYLRKDVLLLAASVRNYVAKLREILGVDPVDLRRWTISSLSFHSVQLYLARNKRLAPFSPTHQHLYKLLRRSALGGLTMLLRASAGNVRCEDEPEGYKEPLIHQHWLDKEKEEAVAAGVELEGDAGYEEAKFVWPLDISSLYATAGENRVR